LFFYHARNGLLIRKGRTGKTPLQLRAIRQHRQMGPVLALLGGGGYFAGLTLVMIDSGNPLQHPPHLFAGTAILLLLFLAYRSSLKIAGSGSSSRDLHYRLGLAILVLYLVNAVLGLGILL
jgi:hypothetical protein